MSWRVSVANKFSYLISHINGVTIKRGKTDFWANFLSLKDLFDLILHTIKVLNCLSYVCMFFSFFSFFSSFILLTLSSFFLIFPFLLVFFCFFFRFLYSVNLSLFLFFFFFYLSFFLFPKSGGPLSLYLLRAILSILEFSEAKFGTLEWNWAKMLKNFIPSSPMI